MNKPTLKFKADYNKTSSGARHIQNSHMPKTVHYFCDGSGKDTYIVYDFELERMKADFPILLCTDVNIIT